MARNEEKSHAMLNKWLAMKQQFGEKKEQRRPFLASECSDLNEAEKWRREIVRDIVKKVSEIQNASLGEHAIRDLNDRINKLMRQRYAWERRIVELGGPNYTKSSKTYDAEGKELPGGGGYKYFGAARELPGVRELFQTEEHSEPAKRRRGDIYKRITPDYFGFRDEEDGVLLEKEASVERQKVEEADEIWEATKRVRLANGESVDDDEPEEHASVVEIVDAMMASRAGQAPGEGVSSAFQEKLQASILAKKKAELLAKLECDAL